MEWIALVIKMPTEPSRHRVAVWRELRRAGAIQLGPGSWALPAQPVFAATTERVSELVQRGDGEMIALDAAGRDEVSAARLADLYTAARQAEWIEFLSDCEKYLAELDKEIATQKFTLAELDEEEQSMERLRRWRRELTARDIFGAPSAADASARIDACAAKLDDYTGLVFRTLNPEP